MIKNKIETKEQLVGSIISLLIVLLFVVGIPLFTYGYSLFNQYMVGYGLSFILIAIFILLFEISKWGLNNHLFYHGLKYAIKHSIDKHSIRRQLIEAGIYTKKNLFGLDIAVLPIIGIEYDEGYLTGRVNIETSIKHNKPLENVDISPALRRYVVEQQYLSRNKKRYVYEFYDATIDRKYQFDNFEEFKEHSKYIDDYEINIDKNINVPLSHSLIVGQTRSGKSYMLLVSILQMLCKKIKYHLYFIDPKISSIGLVGNKINKDDTAEEYDEIVALLEKFVEKMHDRKKEMSQLLENHLDGDYRTFGLLPHVLIFDEYASFSIMLRNKSKADRDKINDMISEIVLQGSQLGFFIWLVMQKSDSQNIPTSVRDNLMFKLVLGSAEEQTYVTAFGNVDVPKFKFDLGEGLFTFPSITEKPKICSISTLNFDIVKAFDEVS